MKNNENSGVNYGLGEAGDRALATLEKVLRQNDASLLAGMLRLEPEDAQEMMKICEEGVANFEAASQGIAPAQRVIVGIAYTMNALREWREKGPMAGVPGS